MRAFTLIWGRTGEQKKGAVKMSETTVALYMRLSREDNDLKDESNSISNQRKLLLGFLKKKQEFADSPIVQYMDV